MYSNFRRSLPQQKQAAVLHYTNKTSSTVSLIAIICIKVEQIMLTNELNKPNRFLLWKIDFHCSCRWPKYTTTKIEIPIPMSKHIVKTICAFWEFFSVELIFSLHNWQYVSVLFKSSMQNGMQVQRGLAQQHNISAQIKALSLNFCTSLIRWCPQRMSATLGVPLLNQIFSPTSWYWNVIINCGMFSKKAK